MVTLQSQASAFFVILIAKLVMIYQRIVLLVRYLGNGQLSTTVSILHAFQPVLRDTSLTELHKLATLVTPTVLGALIRLIIVLPASQTSIGTNFIVTISALSKLS